MRSRETLTGWNIADKNICEAEIASARKVDHCSSQQKYCNTISEQGMCTNWLHEHTQKYQGGVFSGVTPITMKWVVMLSTGPHLHALPRRQRRYLVVFHPIIVPYFVMKPTKNPYFRYDSCPTNIRWNIIFLISWSHQVWIAIVVAKYIYTFLVHVS